MSAATLTGLRAFYRVSFRKHGIDFTVDDFAFLDSAKVEASRVCNWHGNASINYMEMDGDIVITMSDAIAY